MEKNLAVSAENGQPPAANAGYNNICLGPLTASQQGDGTLPMPSKKQGTHSGVLLFCERATKSSVSRGKNDQKFCRLPFAIRTKIIPKESCFRFRQVQLAFSVIRLFLGMNCTMPHLFIMTSVLRDKLQGVFSAVYSRNEPFHIPKFYTCISEP